MMDEVSQLTVYFRHPLVTFGELKELPYEQELRKAYDIEEDLLNPGGFLISNQHSVATISQEGEINTLAGQYVNLFNG